MYNKRSSRKLWRVLFGVVLCFVASFMLLNNNTFATSSDQVVETNFFGNLEDDGEGCGVYRILNLAIDILSMGVVIAGVIGVTIVGTQYMSAKDSEEKTRKAKNRMLEIVIGLIAYAVLFVGIQWLLPGGIMNENCKTVSDKELATIKAQEKEKKEQGKEQEKEQEKENEKKYDKKDSKTKEKKKEDKKKEKAIKKCKERAAKVVEDKVCKLDSPNEKLATSAKILAWPSGTSTKVYYNYATPEYRKAAKETGVPDRVAADTPELHDHYIGKSCAMYVCVSVAASGVDQYFPGGVKSNRACNTEQIYKYLSGSSRWESVSNPKPGDVIVRSGYTDQYGNFHAGHVATYVKKGNRTVIAQGNLHIHFGVVTNSSAKWSGFTVFRYKGK